MDKQEARQVLISEFERILELPPVEAEAQLQQLLVLIEDGIEDSNTDTTFLDELEEKVETELRAGNNTEMSRMTQKALKRIQ